MAGTTFSEVERLLSSLTPTELRLQRAVDELRHDSILSPDTWAGLTEHFDTRQIIDLLFTVGAYDTLAIAFNCFGVEAVGTQILERVSWDQGTLTHEPQVLGQSAHLWTRTELRPDDVDVALLYDGFTFNCVSWLEGRQALSVVATEFSVDAEC